MSASGSPTVVLEPGAGGTSSQLGWITPAVARSTRVRVYDRAGRGWSETADTTQDGAQIATDLHTLLHRAGVPGPYVLAGHSFGGLYVRIFAAHYPDEVAGLVLVDSTASKEPAKPVIPASDGTAADPVGRVPVLASLSARVGLARLVAQFVWEALPSQSRGEVGASNAQARWVSSTVDEYLRGRVSAQEAASLRDFGNKPLFVLTASQHPASWMAAQDKMSTVSTNSLQGSSPAPPTRTWSSTRSTPPLLPKPSSTSWALSGTTGPSAGDMSSAKQSRLLSPIATARNGSGPARFGRSDDFDEAHFLPHALRP